MSDCSRIQWYAAVIPAVWEAEAGSLNLKPDQGFYLRERERGRETETERQRETERKRQKDRDTHRERDRDKQTETERTLKLEHGEMCLSLHCL